jgi:hypothetical protein
MLETFVHSDQKFRLTSQYCNNMNKNGNQAFNVPSGNQGVGVALAALVLLASRTH